MVCYITELYGMIRNGMVLLHLVQYGTIFRKVQYRCRVYTTYQLYPHSRWWNPIRSHKNETPMENHHITTIHWWSQPPTNMPMKYPMFSQWSHEICPIAWGNLPMLVESSWNPMIIDITTIPWFVSLWKSPWKVIILDAEIPIEVQNPIKNPLKTH